MIEFYPTEALRRRIQYVGSPSHGARKGDIFDLVHHASAKCSGRYPVSYIRIVSWGLCRKEGPPQR
jgi:hypothetical protein